MPFGMRRPPPWRIFEGPEDGAKSPKPQISSVFTALHLPGKLDIKRHSATVCYSCNFPGHVRLLYSLPLSVCLSVSSHKLLSNHTTKLKHFHTAYVVLNPNWCYRYRTVSMFDLLFFHTDTDCWGTASFIGSTRDVYTSVDRQLITRILMQDRSQWIISLEMNYLRKKS